MAEHEANYGMADFRYLYQELGKENNKDGMLPLHVACISDHGFHGDTKNDIIKTLVLRLDDVDVNEPCGRNTICHMLAKRPGEASALDWLLTKHGLEVNPGQPTERLRYRTKEQKRRAMNVHLDSAAGDDGNTPLHIACFKGRFEAMKVLLKHGAKVDVCNLDGKTPNVPKERKIEIQYVEPKGKKSSAGHWLHRGRVWKEAEIYVPERDAKGRIKLSEEEERAKEKAQKQKMKELKKKNEIPKGQVEFPKESIDDVIKYMDPNGDGEVEMEELDMAIRLFNRKKAVAKLEKEARVVMIKLKERIVDLGMSMTEVFELMDKSGDGIISGQELMDGIHVISSGKVEQDKSFDEKFADFLHVSHEEAHEILALVRTGDADALQKLADYKAEMDEERSIKGLSKREITMVRDYMDQEKDNKIELKELLEAFKRADQSPEELAREEVVGFVLGSLEAYMKGRNMKLMQLFEEMDADGSGSLSIEELRDALERMCAPTVHKNKAQMIREKKAQLARKKAQRENDERKARAEAQKKLKEKLDKVKAEAAAAKKAKSPFARAQTASPHSMRRLKPVAKQIVRCGICGGDQDSKGCQMYHQMVEFSISIDNPWMPPATALGPFNRSNAKKWMDPAKSQRIGSPF